MTELALNTTTNTSGEQFCTTQSWTNQASGHHVGDTQQVLFEEECFTCNSQCRTSDGAGNTREGVAELATVQKTYVKGG